MHVRALLVTLVLATAATGCIGATQDIDPAAVADPEAAAAAAGPATELFEGTVVMSAATPVRTVNWQGEYLKTITAGGNVTGFVVEVDWEPATRASESLSVWVRPSGAGSTSDPQSAVMAPENVATVTGTSPLRVELPADAFPEDGEYDVIVRAAGPAGAAANQPFAMHVATFAGVPFDAAYTMLDGDHGH